MIASASELQIIGLEKSDAVGPEADYKDLLVCTCKSTEDLTEGMSLLAKSTLYQQVGQSEPLAYSLVERLSIEAVDQPTHSFSTLVDKWITLKVNNIYERVIGKRTTLHVYFDKSHFLSNGFAENEYTTPNTTDTELNDFNERELNNTELFITFPYHGDIVTFCIDVSNYGNILTHNTLVIDMDKVKDSNDGEFQQLVTYLELEREELPNVGGTNELVGVFYNLPKSSLTFRTKNRRYEERTLFTLSYEQPGATVDIAIPQKFSLGLNHASDIWNDFAKEKMEGCINTPNEMERDVYHPVYWDDDKRKFRPIYAIKFNLHFREHRGDKWAVNPETYWNGTAIDTNRKVRLLSNWDIKYFAYTEPSQQSDLLTYLNYTNNDIKYQKNKLKRSFLRLSFYDSVLPSEQNLLATSTVFTDAGKLFTKYVKNLEEPDAYNEITYTSNSVDGKPAIEKTSLTGARVNREFTKGDKLDNDAIEDKRLSSQFVIKDRDMSQASSEGFYLYLWRDNRTGTLANDLYMMVEFNHAGYGFTIPFMMPYWDRKKHHDAKCGVKTFQEILDDWNQTPDSDTPDSEAPRSDGPYGIRQYLKFVYIHLKYQYDKENDRFVYYVDTEDTYKGGKTKNLMYDENTGTLYINLYEAKIATPKYKEEDEKHTSYTAPN